MLWTVVNLSTWKMDQKVIKRQSGHTCAMNHPTPWSYTLDNNFQIILDQIYYHLLSKICNANLLVLECHVLFSLQNPHLIIHITQRLPFKYIYLHYLHQKSNNCSSPVSFRYKAPARIPVSTLLVIMEIWLVDVQIILHIALLILSTRQCPPWGVWSS
jgi:hypothetical protein